MELLYYALAALALVIASLIRNVISSLILHPLAKIPGPKYAAVTHYYQFYYDVIRRGRFPWKLKQLHEKYGAPEPPNDGTRPAKD
jgi:hypothetical protein